VTNGEARGPGHDERVARLEARIDELEARLGRLEGAPAAAEPSIAIVQPSIAAAATPPATTPPATTPPAATPATFTNWNVGAPWPPAPATPIPAAATPPAGARQPPDQYWRTGEVAPKPVAKAEPAARPAVNVVNAGSSDVLSPSLPSFSLRDLEERFAGRALAWTGGLALVAAAIFFLSLAFSRGWIGEELRVVIGLAAGATAFAGGAWFLGRANALLGNVLTAVGAGVLSIALLAATRLYGLIPLELGLAGALVVAVASAAVALRTNSRVVAGYGLVAVLVAPPLLGASPNLLTLAFVATALIGTTAIALFRSWRWLPLLAFILAAPQLGVWLRDEPNAAIGLVVLTGFWFLNVIAAAGEEARIRRDDLRGSSATLVVLNALFLIGGGFAVLDGELAWSRAPFLVSFAVAHLTLAGWFFIRQGQAHRFGNLLAGTGVALIALAAPVQLGAPMVPVAWAAEAVVLAWLGATRRHGYSLAAATVLAALSVTHLMAVEYPTSGFGDVLYAPAFLHAEAASIVFVVGAILVAAVIVPGRAIRSALAALGVLLVAYALPFELDGPALIGALVLLLLTGLALDRALERVSLDRASATWLSRLLQPGSQEPSPNGFASFATAAGGVAWLGAVLFVLADNLRPEDWGRAMPPAIPFSDERALVGALLVAGALVAAVFEVGRSRRLALVAAAAVAGYLIPFEVFADGVVILWSGLALAVLVAARLDRDGFRWYGVSAAAFVVGSVAVALILVAPPARLLPSEFAATARLPLLQGWAIGIASIVGVLRLGARDIRLARYASWLETSAGAALVYLCSIGVVAAFQGQVGGSVATEELAKQAQVGLSSLWTALGAGALVAGLALRTALLRQAGLGLLALATAKVFLVDLASLDVAYRVLSFAGLGILLLLSAYLVNRFRGPRSGPSEIPEG
jgi:uncharacterized membrane protein